MLNGQTQNHTSIYGRTIFYLKGKDTDIYYNINEYWKHAKWKKKSLKLYESICMKYSE